MMLNFTPSDIEASRRAFHEFGPTARLCINYVEDPDQLEFYESSRRTALSKLSLDSLVNALQEGSNLDMHLSHTIFLMRRVEESEESDPENERYLQRYTLEPITRPVRQELRLKLMKARREERLRLYQVFETVPQSRPMAGMAFEAIGQSRLQKEVALTLVPMVWHPPTAKGKLASWKRQFIDESEASPEESLEESEESLDESEESQVMDESEESQVIGESELEESQVMDESVSMATEGPSSSSVVDGQFSISFKPYDIIQFEKRALKTLRPGIFYVPKSSSKYFNNKYYKYNQEAFDSFIVVDRVLYIFQFTIADRHPIKGGLVDFFTRESFRPILRGTEWRFIFVIPQGNDIACSESTDTRMKNKFWGKAKLYTAEIDPAND
jgi:hypothetical protein